MLYANMPNDADASMDLSTWLSTTEAARALGLSAARVLQLADSGELRCVRAGSLGRLFDPESVAKVAKKRGVL